MKSIYSFVVVCSLFALPSFAFEGGVGISNIAERYMQQKYQQSEPQNENENSTKEAPKHCNCSEKHQGNVVHS